ncbi:hypothetical protein GJ496_002319 [Pomphorhynchus laevis]|nr:hypothetical protein GJ496_002319 [Pomphorhynchus laevis]
MSRHFIERKPRPIKTIEAFTDETCGEFTMTIDYFKAKRDAFLPRGTLDKLFLSAQRKTDTWLIVSYEIAEIIGKSGLSHAIEEKLHMYMIPFPTTYLIKAGFSKLLSLWTKYRNRLNIERRGDLRMSLSTMNADMAKLASKHQFQGSH